MTIERYEGHAVPSVLLNPITDSWTAVLSDVGVLAQNIANTEFVPKDLRGSVPKVAAAILSARELGLPPMTGLAGVHVINGRPGISAELMRALILQAGHQIHITESSAGRCVMKGRRSGWDEWTTVSYTMEEAARAGDVKKNPNYGSRPAEMLLARATTRLARMIFADVIHGMRSTEELLDLAEDSDGVVLPVVQEAAKVSRQQRPAPAAIEPPAPAKAPPAATPQPPAPELVQDAQEAPAAPEPPQERRRPPLRRRGAETAPEEPQQAPQPAQETQEAPADSGTVTGLEEARKAARQKSVAVIMQHWQRLGVTERDERLWFTGILVGRPDLASTNDLDAEGLRELLKKLERTRDYDSLPGVRGGEPS